MNKKGGTDLTIISKAFLDLKPEKRKEVIKTAKQLLKIQNEVCKEIHTTMEEIVSLGYRRIDKTIVEKLALLREKAGEFNMNKGGMHIDNLIEAINIHEKTKNHITNDELAKKIMTLTFYSENILKYNDTSEL
jgi:oligoribonuclease (3'-5' exoribonuclease)